MPTNSRERQLDVSVLPLPAFSPPIEDGRPTEAPVDPLALALEQMEAYAHDIADNSRDPKKLVQLGLARDLFAIDSFLRPLLSGDSKLKDAIRLEALFSEHEEPKISIRVPSHTLKTYYVNLRRIGRIPEDQTAVTQTFSMLRLSRATSQAPRTGQSLKKP